MRDLGVVLVLAILLIAGIYLYLRWHGQLAGIQNTAPTAGDTADTSKVHEAGKSGRGSAKNQEKNPKFGLPAAVGQPSSSDSDLLISEETAPGRTDIFIDATNRSSKDAVSVTAFPFPTERDLTRSMPRAQILAQFGSPSLTASTIRDGSLFESYYYVKPDHTLMTVTVLQNGALSSVYSTRP